MRRDNAAATRTDPGVGRALDEADWDTARSLAHGAVSRLPALTVPLAGALGRTLADPLLARLALPGFDTAAMDGYAVRGRAPWRLTGQTMAGQAAGPELAAGHAREVATGAPVPPGARAVVPYELASRSGELVTSELVSGELAGSEIPPGLNIRRTGEEARPGDVLLAAGVRVTPQVIGLAAALGYDDLPVVARPRLAALITGDELLADGLPYPGRVRDAVGPALAGLAAAAGGEIAAISYLPDRGEALAGALRSATAAEVVLVVGSSSVGRADYLHRCLAELGASAIVGSVACKPGRTQSLGRLPDGRVVIGLPGNPFAAFAAFLTLAAPCCAGFLGAPLGEPRPVELGVLKAHPHRTRLVPVRFSSGRVEPIPHDGSAMLKGLALAEALAVVPPATDRRGQARLLPLPG